MDFSILKDQVITKIEGAEVGGEDIYFTTSDNKCYSSTHQQDCCESVSIYSINGNIEDILNLPILEASEDHPDYDYPHKYPDSYTWTEQILTTDKGTLVILWLGESNGYYGEVPYFGFSHQVL